MSKFSPSKKEYMLVFLLGLILLVPGCRQKETALEDNAQVVVADYQKNTYRTVFVQHGTIEPTLILKLKPDEYETTTYQIHKKMLEVEDIKVDKGSKVQKGDVLVTFKAEDIKEKIAEYEQRKDEDQMLIDHYTKLMKISKENDYSADLKKLKKDLSVANLYISEQTARLSGYEIVADKAGTVTDIHEDLLKGYGTAGKGLITVASGSSNYTATTTDPYVFKEGDSYEATYGIAVYEMKIIGVEQTDAGTVITFEPQTDMSGVTESDELTMTINKDKISNAVYVDKDAIFTVENKQYAYVVNDKGFRRAVEVTIKDTVDDYVIIKDGLSKGEQVTLN